jgi:hypothetical protein
MDGPHAQLGASWSRHAEPRTRCRDRHRCHSIGIEYFGVGRMNEATTTLTRAALAVFAARYVQHAAHSASTLLAIMYDCTLGL